MRKNQPTLIPYLAAGAFLLSSLFLNAADTNKWESSGAAGLTLSRGNTESLLGTVALNSTRKWPHDEILLGASGTYGENTDQDTDDTEETDANVQGFGQYNHLFTEKLYGGVRLHALHDKIADVKYRITLSPMLGYYVIKNPKTKLAFEVGPSGVLEKQGDEEDEYIALRLGERFEHKFSEKAKMWQSCEYMPQIDRWGNYIINFEIGVEASLTETFALRAVLQDTYDGEPAPHRKNNDVKLITSIVYKF